MDDRVVSLPVSQCSEVLDTIIDNNLAALASAPYDGSPITIAEHNGCNFQGLQADKNVRAALTHEYLICRKMSFGWGSHKSWIQGYLFVSWSD